MNTISKNNTLEGKGAPSHIVGIGASAGGLEAIETFFKNMPSKSGLAFVVIQHLSPDYKSLMVELLAKRTNMLVQKVEDGMEVRPDVVHLIPPNKNLTVFHGKLLLTTQDRTPGVNLPIDIFFKSLAEDQGGKAIAIVLSGTGSDGTRGIRAIKEEVGMVMVQQEDTATFDGMPRSAIATGMVDYILPPEEMPRQLLSYAEHPYASKAELSDTLLTDEDGLARIFALLREKTKIDFTYYKPTTVVRRIERRMTINQVQDLRDYVRHIETHPVETSNLARDLLIGVTNFFRDPEAFDLLRDNYLAEILQKPSGEIRLWVAGCSTGEEAYSMAILCQELMERLGVDPDLKIFATDVDKEAVVQASGGEFPDSIAADVAPALLSKYFYKKDDGFQISRQIREMVVFAQHNLIKDPPFTNIDLVSCRNLLIYLQPILQQKALEYFNFALAPQGILFLGSSETTGELAGYFEPLHQKWRLFRSKGKRHPTGLLDANARFDSTKRMRNSILPRGPSNGRVHEEERMLERLLECLAGDIVPFCMVITDQLELLHVIGDTRTFLRFPSGKLTNDISKMVVKDLAIPLTTGVQKVFKSNEELKYSNIRARLDGQNSTIDMTLRPLPKKKGQEPLLAALVQLKSIKSDEQSAETISYDIGKEAEQRIADLEQELQFTRENLQATVEELETSNEELQATNEELLASNEELQSTNEELQSVNEELYTVNAEYQSKITELTEVNNDLDNLLINTRAATLFLDENLDIRRFTPEVTRLFKLMKQDIGRPFSHIAHELADVNLLRMVSEVHTKNSNVEVEVKDTAGDLYHMRVLPYQIAPEIYAGVVLIFVNINTTRAMERAMEKAHEEHSLIRQETGMGSWEWDIVTGGLIWSDEVEALFGFEPGGFEKTFEVFLGCVHPDDRKRVKKALDDAAEKDTQYRIDHRIVWPDDSIRWVHESGAVHRNAQGRPLRMLGVVQDITDLKRIEEKEYIARAKLESTYRALPIGIGIINDRTITWANKQLLSMTGYSTDEVEGRKSRFLYLSEEEFNRVGQEKYRQMRESGVGTVETQWRRADGTVIDVLLSSTPMDINQFNADITFAAADITQRKRVERDLAYQRRLLTTVLDSMVDCHVLIDSKGVIQEVNPAIRALFGYEPQELMGKNVSVIMPEPHQSRHDAYIENYLRTGEAHIIGNGRYVKALHKDGSLFEVDLTVSEVVVDNRHLFSGLIRRP